MIRLTSDDITSDPIAINNEFVDYYSKLYSSETSSCFWDGPNPLDLLTYPKITPAVASNLGAPITISEVKDAISSLHSNKSPGPDGFTIEFYKTYSVILAPRLVQVFHDAHARGLLPTTMSEASITLSLKKDKDPLLCSSYRPISLLNVDFKILAKVLAGCFQKVIPSLINPDQTGFITGRHSSSNTLRLLNILYFLLLTLLNMFSL